MAIPHRGRPLPNIDRSTLTWTAEERAEVVRWYELAHGYGDTRIAKFVPFQIDYNPAAFKRYWAMIPAMTPVVPRGIFTTHLYAVLGHSEGLQYELIMSRQVGWSKRQVIEAINFATYLGGPNASNAVAAAVRPYLEGWDDDRDQGEIPWPEGWYIDPDVLKSGIAIDDSTELTGPELDGLKAWHQRSFGEVASFVDLWAEFVGPRYKINRTRFEVLAGETLAVQVYPLMLAHASAWLERQSGVLLGLKWARNLGVTRQQAVEVLDLVFFWGGEFKMSAVLTDAVVDLIRNWE